MDDHLEGVAWRCEHFGQDFSSGDWGRLAGLLHDLGKYQEAFQAKLSGERIQVDHSSAGAAMAAANKEMGIPLAFAIAGHHAGLANLAGSEPGQPSPLKQRILTGNEVLTSLSDVLPKVSFPAPPERFRSPGNLELAGSQRLRRSVALWTRFLFSALVDADRLDAEAFCTPGTARQRGAFGSVETLADCLDRYIDSLTNRIPADRSDAPVNKARAAVLESCRTAASLPQGAFSLTVPTGGGKTLSAMSFALRHARQHGLRRVFVVIPYTSIIEQNATVYRSALGVENVIEHHSNLDPECRQQELGEEAASRHDLAEENWDAPAIVTTTVQFFETLFSNRPGRCRKLHNVAGSVIVLDEVQTLPPEFLAPILEVLQELLDHYGCSLVLSTATPPALAAREGFPAGIRNVRPIIPDPARLADDLRRVAYHWPDPAAPPTTLSELAEQLATRAQVLAVVHRRADARELARLLTELTESDSVFHLSALMCPAHRLETLRRIHARLACGTPCRVVSTQLVEAGVDLDFPVVYRALGGLDSVAQAAGRCNREGLRASGEVHIFRAETPPPTGTPRHGMEVAQTMLGAFPTLQARNC